MKKLIGILLIVCFAISVQAQKGQFTLGLDWSQNDKNFLYSYDIYPYGYYGPVYNFHPKVGYFIADNIEIGLGYKSGEYYRETETISYNPNGVGENYSYINSTNDTYKSISPYVKYYFNSMFVSARFSLNETSNYNLYNNPVWELDTNGQYFVNGMDQNEYNYTNQSINTEITVGYVLSYNDKLFFEPSVSVVNTTGDVESVVTNTSSEGIVTDASHYDFPKSESTQFRLNIGVSLRLGK